MLFLKIQVFFRILNLQLLLDDFVSYEIKITKAYLNPHYESSHSSLPNRARFIEISGEHFTQVLIIDRKILTTINLDSCMS